MSGDANEFDPVVDLANEYLKRYRNGENPSVSEYVEKHPELAEQIRDVFPMMLLMEDHAPSATQPDAAGGNGSPAPTLERLGDFRILREIGRGGMGIVYEAVQESLGRHVALKVFPTHSHLNPHHQERFKRESRSAAMLHHTNIVPVFAVGDDDGMLFYAMQFIRGAGLDEVIAELHRLRPSRDKTAAQTKTAQSLVASQVAQSMLSGVGGCATLVDASVNESVNAPSSASHRDGSMASGVHLPGQSEDSTLSETGKEYWNSVARIGVQVAQALEYAHGQKTLHRDIKPSNLLLDQDATVWLTDFGLAKSFEADDLTHTGELIGTLRYMPPEQFAGKADERSDLYSLGLTLYEMLTLRPAFDMPDRQRLIRAINESSPARPRRVNSQIPRDLETIVLKCIDHDQSRRYQNANQLVADLTRFLNNEPLKARPVSMSERMIKWAKRRPAIASLAAALAITFCVSFGLVTWKWLEAVAIREELKDERDEARRLETAERNAKLGEAAERKRKEELLEESEQNLYYSLIAQADFQRQQNDIEASRRTLDLADEDRRGWEWHYLKGQLHLDLMTLSAGTNDAPWIRTLAFSNDGRLLATGSTLPNFSNARVGSSGAARIWDLATGRKIVDFGDRTKSITGMAFSPNGKQIAINDVDLKRSNTSLLRVWDVGSQTELVRMSDENYSTRLPPYFDLQFSPDGSLLIGERRRTSSNAGDGFASPDELRVWDAMSGRPLWSRRITNVSVQFSADSSRIKTRLVSDSDNTWGEFDARTGQVLKKLQQPIGHHAGDRVINRQDTFIRVLDKVSGDLLYSLRDPHGKLGTFTVHPDGSQLATASLDGTIRLWNLETGEQENILRGHSTQLLSVRYSPDGRYLASGDWDGNVKVWFLDGTHSFVSNVTGRIEDIAFRFGGRALATVRHPGALQTWDVLTGQRLSSFQPDVFTTRGLGPVRQVAFDGSGSRVAGGSRSDRTVFKVWDVETGQEQLSLPGHQDLINYVAFSGNGERVASASGNFPEALNVKTIGRVKVWDVRLDNLGPGTGADRLLLEIAHPGQRTTALAMTGDGTRLAVAGYFLRSSGEGNSTSLVPLFGIWDIETGRKLDLPATGTDGRGTDVHGMAFSSDGTLLAAVEYRTGRVHLYDTKQGKEKIQFDGPTGIQDLAFSPAGKRLAGVTRELTTIWDVQNGREVMTLRGKRKESDTIFNPAVRFSPNGHHLASTQWHKDYSFLIRTTEFLSDNEPGQNPASMEPAFERRSPKEALKERLEQLNQLVQDNPDGPTYQLARSRIYARLGENEKALADLQFVKENLFENSLFLTGDEHIRLPHLAFDEIGSFTLEAWVKNWQGAVVYQGYGYAGSRGRRESTVQFTPVGGSMQAGQGAEGNFSFADGENFVFRFEKADIDAWSHCAVVYDDEAAEIRCYTNGQLNDTKTNVDRIGPFHPDRPFWIGYHPNTRESNGQMRSFRISQTARYEDDFVPDRQLQADDETHLLFDFTSNDILQSTRIPDLSDSGNHGQLVGAWWTQNVEAPEAIEVNADESTVTTPTGTQAYWNKRLENLTAIVDAEPKNGSYRLARSKTYATAGDLENASADYLAAIDLLLPGSRSGWFFEAEQFIETAHLPLDAYESYTIEAWVQNWNGMLIFQADALQPGLVMDRRGGVLAFREQGESGYAFADASDYDDHAYRFRFGELPSNQWVHLAVVRSGHRLLSFANGRLISAVENLPKSAPLDRDQPFWIGGLPDTHYKANRSGAGLLHSIRVSKSARYVDEFSPAEQLGTDDDTILLFDISKPDEFRDSRIIDRSGNGNDGTLRSAWWLK